MTLEEISKLDKNKIISATQNKTELKRSVKRREFLEKILRNMAETGLIVSGIKRACKQ